MLNFPRFDLSESSYPLAIMADLTPAWREVYAKILNQLIERHTPWTISTNCEEVHHSYLIYPASNWHLPI